MHERPTLVAAFAVIAAVGITAHIGHTQTTPPNLGVFTDEGSIGQTTKGSSNQYDPVKGEYRITAGGANVWGATDALYFVWKKVTGDATLQADVQWIGASPTEHRKAMLMFRQNLDPDAAYADAVAHGNGLMSLQFRGAPKEQTYQIFTTGDYPARFRLVRKGSRFIMYVGKPGEYLQPVGPVEYITLQGEVYVGIGVCSHDASRLETAVFSNVKLEPGSNY